MKQRVEPGTYDFDTVTVRVSEHQTCTIHHDRRERTNAYARRVIRDAKRARLWIKFTALRIIKPPISCPRQPKPPAP